RGGGSDPPGARPTSNPPGGAPPGGGGAPPPPPGAAGDRPMFLPASSQRIQFAPTPARSATCSTLRGRRPPAPRRVAASISPSARLAPGVVSLIRFPSIPAAFGRGEGVLEPRHPSRSQSRSIGGAGRSLGWPIGFTDWTRWRAAGPVRIYKLALSSITAERHSPRCGGVTFQPQRRLMCEINSENCNGARETEAEVGDLFS